MTYDVILPEEDTCWLNNCSNPATTYCWTMKYKLCKYHITRLHACAEEKHFPIHLTAPIIRARAHK